MPNSLFRSAPVSSASSKTIVVSSLVALLFIASSLNLQSFSKISIHIGDVHHASGSDVASTHSDSAITATNVSSSSSAREDQSSCFVSLSHFYVSTISTQALLMRKCKLNMLESAQQL